MNFYEIFVPELATYVKFKILPAEYVADFREENENLNPNEYTKLVLETTVYNMKTEIVDSLKAMSTTAAKLAIESLYNGCIMLNPGLDIDEWIRIAYNGSDEDELNKAFNKKTLKNEDTSTSTSTSTLTKNETKKRKITKAKFANLKIHLDKKVIGQEKAVNVVVSALKRSQAGMNDLNRPLGVFLFAGSSGVGKTHLARELHNYLYGSDSDIVRIDCGEYQHKHDNQKITGSPPGYIGHDEGGMLANAIFANPNTVLLLDEVEKAHPDIFNTFLRVFDEGMLTDNKGRQIDFRNTVIIMTTNLGNDKIVQSLTDKGVGFTPKDIDTKKLPPHEQVERLAQEEIKKMFRPEFLNRIDKIIVFNHLSHGDHIQIAELELVVVDDKLSKKGITFKYDDSVVQALIDRGVDTILGARGMASVRRDFIENLLADKILEMRTLRGSVFDLSYDGAFKLEVRTPVKADKNKLT